MGTGSRTVSDQHKWRDSRPKACGLCGRQWPTERFDLVEMNIASARRARIAEQTLKDRMDAPDDRGLMLLYQARIQELEGIVAKQNQRIAGRRSA